MSGPGAVAGAVGRHWDGVYATKAPETVSWLQQQPDISLRLLAAAGDRAGPVIDVGAGRSPLAGALLACGWSDVTVLDVSAHALQQPAAGLGEHRDALTVIVADLLPLPRRAGRPGPLPGDRRRAVAPAGAGAGHART